MLLRWDHWTKCNYKMALLCVNTFVNVFVSVVLSVFDSFKNLNHSFFLSESSMLPASVNVTSRWRVCIEKCWQIGNNSFSNTVQCPTHSIRRSAGSKKELENQPKRKNDRKYVASVKMQSLTNNNSEWNNGRERWGGRERERETRDWRIDHWIVSDSVVADHRVLELLSPTSSSSSPALCRRQQQCVRPEMTMIIIIYYAFQHTTKQMYRRLSRCSRFASYAIDEPCANTQNLYIFVRRHHTLNAIENTYTTDQRIFPEHLCFRLCLCSFFMFLWFSHRSPSILFSKARTMETEMAETARFAMRTEKCIHFKRTFHDLGTKSKQTLLVRPVMNSLTCIIMFAFDKWQKEITFSMYYEISRNYGDHTTCINYSARCRRRRWSKVVGRAFSAHEPLVSISFDFHWRIEIAVHWPCSSAYKSLDAHMCRMQITAK